MAKMERKLQEDADRLIRRGEVKAMTVGGGDWRDELLEACKTDPGAHVETDALAKISALRKANPAEWQRLRAKLKAIKGVSMSELEGLLKHEGDGRQGNAIQWADPEPHPDPQDGAALLDDVTAALLKYVGFADEQAAACAAWIVMTYIHGRLDNSPFLNITSATKREGKTTLLNCIGEFVFRPLPSSGRVTPAALFRIIQQYEPTMLLDESDTYLMDDPELRGVVNGSEKRLTATVIRCVGDDHETRTFSTFCPKVIAGIGGLPETTLDRSIILLMKRLPKGQRKPRWRDRDFKLVPDLRSRIARWVQDDAEKMLAAREAVSTTFSTRMNDRQCDGWEILFAIAHVAGGSWPDLMARAAHLMIDDQGDNLGMWGELLRDVKIVFEQEGNPDWLPTDNLIQSLSEMPHGRWLNYRAGKQITVRQLSDMLRRFKIAPTNIRFDGKTLKGYYRNDFQDAFSRYLGDSSRYNS